MKHLSLSSFTQREGDLEVYDHQHLPLSFDLHNTCASCRASYRGKDDWLKCKLCEQWFHEK